MILFYKTPEQWRDMSIGFKLYDDTYLSVIDVLVVDSLQFWGHPAAMAGFVAVIESGDTVIHKQLVVLVGEELYYLNNTYNWNNDGSDQA